MGHHLTSIIFHGLNTFLVVLIIIRLVNYAKHKAPSPTLPRYESIPTIEGGISQGAPINGKAIYKPSPLVGEGKGEGDNLFLNSTCLNTSIIAGAVTGLLFGIHSIHVESVAWISERKDVLYAFFFLLSILSYLKYTSSHPHPNLGTSRFRPPPSRERTIEESLPSPCGRGQRGGEINYILCLLFFVLSLMSKPMAVTLPVVLLILDVYPLGRLDFKHALTSQRKVLIEKIPFLCLSLASSVITVMAAQQKAIVPLEVHPLGERLLIAIRTPIFYLFKMLFPISLAPLYPYPSKISFLTVEYIGSFILVVCITAFCIWSWKRHRTFLAIWAYYIVTLLPVLGIIHVGVQTVADRFTYLPSLGLFLLAGLGTSWLWTKFNIRKHMLIIFIIILIFTISLLSFLTIKQTKIWRDSLTLWNHELKIFPNSYEACRNRGQAYSDLGNYTQAIKDYDRAIKLNPFDTRAYVNRGVAYAELGNFQKAVENYNIAIRINPNDIKAYYNRAIDYKALGKYQQAIKDFDTAISVDSQYSAAYSNRGDTYLNLGNCQKAIQDFNMAIELLPHDAETCNKRGIAYRDLGDFQQALQDFNMAIKLRPEYLEAYNNRGNIYATIGKYQQAIKDFDIAIKLNPKAVDVYFNRGMLYFNLGNNNQAVRDFQTAARLGDKDAQDYLQSKGIVW
jgi:tetratricopeptide (TPR) repeat protein